MQGKPWNVYICRWKYIKTVTTYRNLGFYGETEPFEDPLLCHQFECRRRHFEKQLCNPWRKHTTSLKSTQMADQNVSSTNGFCLIYCLAAYAWVRIIRVRMQPWYESFTLLVSGQVTKEQSSFRRIRRKVTFLSGMSQRGRFLIPNMLFHGAMVSEAYFQFSSKIPKRHWEYLLHAGNSGGVFSLPICSVCSSNLFTFDTIETGFPVYCFSFIYFLGFLRHDCNFLKMLLFY